MSHVLTFTLPPTGEVADSARLVSWLVQPGQTFNQDDVLLEIETDKSVIEIPAPCAGTLIEHLVGVDGVVSTDAALARLEVEGDAPGLGCDAEPSRGQVDSMPVNAPVKAAVTSRAEPLGSQAQVPSAQAASPRATPAARRVMGERQLDASQISGSGPHGRITLADVDRAGVSRPSSGPGGHVEFVDTRHGKLAVRTWEPVGVAVATGCVVLIHGMFADTDAWAALALNLSREGLHVRAIDLPGHGESAAQARHFSELVDAVADAISEVPGPPPMLVGHSLGGAVAARLAGRPTLAARALVLIAPMGLGTEIDHQFMLGVLNARNNEALGRELARLTRAGTKPSDAYMDDLRSRIEQRREGLLDLKDAVGWNGVQQISVAADLQAARCPITILHGRSDAIIPWQHALNAPSRAALHLISDVGHMPQWEAATLTADAILRASRSA